MNLIYSPNNYTHFIELLQQELGLPLSQIESRVNRNLIADYTLELPHKILDQANSFVSHLTKISNNLNIGGFSPSLDFHWSRDTEQLKLIEANTNAAFLGLSIPLYEAAYGDSQLKKECLAKQLLHCLNVPYSPTKEPRLNELAIVDNSPQEQGLYIEFLYYQKILAPYFEQVHIKDPSMLSGQESGIYNRVTDFYFKNPENQKLLDFWTKYPDRVTPNPKDYQDLANKENLQIWSTHEYLSPFIAKVIVVTDENKDEIWSQRKSLFFKPNLSFGSKMTYRGSSISRRHFDSLVESKVAIAQEYVPAPEVRSEHHGLLKFDLRFYFNQGKVTQTVSRLYQGQVTNSKTPGGGFAAIRWI